MSILSKKTILIFMIICLLFTFVSTIGYITNLNYLRLNLIDIIFQVLFCIGIFFYYRKNTNTPEPETVNVKNTIKKEQSTEKNENNDSNPRVSFNEVAGLNEVKEELYEVIDFISNPDKYKKMGAKLPKGLMFYGPPGTGKTLLAQAIAGESGASFINTCGSEFVEKYVGIGAKRVRTLFEKAKRQAPAVIFIDEIDAIGAKRTNESNNEKDQTLNQLLVEMDGFNSNETIIVIGATNRLDLLDEALLRPGRFDRQIYVGNPDVKAREEILEVHFKNKPIEKSIKIKSIAKKTPGMSGAHLANIANEAAILAVRNRKNNISDIEINEAIEKVIAGLERKNAVISDIEKKKVAYHEAGHALIGKILDTDCISKVSIIPRGKALGYTMQIPEEDRYLITTDELYSKIKVLFGGRAAEQLMFNEISTGAKDDLEKANTLAYQMVCEYGMSKLGNRVFNEKHVKDYYPVINAEIKNIIDESYRCSFDLLNKNKKILMEIAEELFVKETLNEDDLNNLFYKKRPQY